MSNQPGVRPDTLFRALTFAATKHRDQRRKDVGASPYINHPMAVARVLSVEGGVHDEATLLAAVLHDTVEDTETTFEELEREFGAEVSGLVRELTDDKSLPKEERKEKQIENIRLKIADKICNLPDVTHNPPEKWDTARRIEYLEWAERVVAGCRGVEPALDTVFDAVLREGRAILGRE